MADSKQLTLITLTAALLSICVGARADNAFLSGACVHVGHNQNTLAAASTGLAPFNSFRDEVSWGRIEQQQGELTFPDNLRDLDQLVTQAVQQGKRPLLILDYGNRYYDGGDLPSSPEAIAAYARYVRFVVHHFKGRVDQFEVWNEWNIGLGSPSKPRPRGQPAGYIALLQAAYQAVKAENPAATVIGGAVSGTDDGWIDSFGGRGGFAYLDAFSVHPYVYMAAGPAPNAPILDKIGAAVRDTVLDAAAGKRAYADSPSIAKGTPESAIKWLDSLKVRVDRYAKGRNVPIYITEIGWPTNIGAHGVSEQVAADYAKRFLLLARARPWIAGVWWYDLIDDGRNAADKEQRFGLMRTDGSPKPAYQALVSIQSTLTAPGPISGQANPTQP